MQTKLQARPTEHELKGLTSDEQKELISRYRRDYQRRWREERHKNPKLQALDKALDLLRYNKKMKDPEGYKKIQESRLKSDAKRDKVQRSAERLVRYHETKTPEKQKEISRKSRLKKYNLTGEELDALKVKQNNKCAICGKEETLVKREQVCELSIDHDHKTGKERGLLCNNYNRAMGMFGDDKKILSKAVEYLAEDRE